MISSGSQLNTNFIEPLPRFFTVRFGRRIQRNPDDDNDDKTSTNNREQKLNEVHCPPVISANVDESSSICITGIRSRDWNFYDDIRDLDDKVVPTIKYRVVPSIHNTIRNRSANFPTIMNEHNHYEEYDLDEQDLQWLIAYNQFRIENNLSELDENIFEYIMQLLEHQCLVTIRQRNFEDTIECDACHRIDDVNDLIQCVQCKIIVHKKCYGLDEDENGWLCLSCQHHQDQHHCCLCERTEGALKCLKTSSNDQKQWIHLSCAFWLPQIEFDEKMTPILKEPLKSTGRCLICDKTTGVKITCSWKNCQNRFHCLCAILAGQDLLLAENDDKTSVRLLALCQRHTEKLDPLTKRIRRDQFFKHQHKRLEQFESYINLEVIQKQISILPDILESIHTYWLLKRQANECRPLIDIPNDIFYHGYDKNVNIVEFSRRYLAEHEDSPIDSKEDKNNALKFLATNIRAPSSSNENLFVKYAQRNRLYFVDYERNHFCLIDTDRKHLSNIQHT